MTADFTRWSKTGKQGVLAAIAAFPVGNFLAQLVGAFIVALGASVEPATNGGDFLATLVAQGGVLVPLGILFVFVNLGSVCAHCLYNGSLGFGHITGRTMRRLTIVLGAIGVVAAVAGIWSYFAAWLNILGVLVPPIGIILILDQLVITHFTAPELSDAIVALTVGALAFTALTLLPGRLPAGSATPVRSQ
jgi:cytosine permease